MSLSDELKSLALRLVDIQEDLPDEDDRNALGEAAHYLEKYAASLVSPAERGGAA